MTNYIEFEGELVGLKGREGEKPGYIWLEGFTPAGYTTSVTFESNEEIFNQCSKAGKHDRIAICGHIEVRSRMSPTDKVRKRTILVADRVISIKDNKGYELE